MAGSSIDGRGFLLPLLAFCVLVMPRLAIAQTASQTESIPAIMPTLAGPAKPRTTPWEELCTTRGLIAPWMSYSACTNSAMLAQLTKSDCSPYATRTLKDTDASGVLTDCLCPAYQTIGRDCLTIVCPTEAANLYTQQLLQGVCPGVTATGNVNDTFPTQTTMSKVTGSAAAAETSSKSGPDGAAGMLAIPLSFSIAATIAVVLSSFI
ncbi:uncharacterized protein CTRU02_203967 [Colletotrichum truncatum]|uniref:Uncharacterized protein n=1 Tax=Colletotrichum truncatum TaxID=5467 RepID=A0ACC3ZAM3_COLTU|nr:uncharacterized protein CTRU02_15449 [Colletotrichum truncatum]KAF6781048.1 hypothetical protein CTRU02_15449 [Colletotrichum truncatum]